MNYITNTGFLHAVLEATYKKLHTWNSKAAVISMENRAFHNAAIKRNFLA
jgi:hypothetical protein